VRKAFVDKTEDAMDARKQATKVEKQMRYPVDDERMPVFVIRSTICSKNIGRADSELSIYPKDGG